MGANKKMRTHAVMRDVLSDLDLVAHILRGNLGPSTLVAASAVSTVGLSELYQIGKSIGEGAFGFVRIAQHRLSGQRNRTSASSTMA